VEFRLKIFGCFVEGWLKGYMDKDIRISMENLWKKDFGMLKHTILQIINVSGVGVGYEKRFWIQGL